MVMARASKRVGGERRRTRRADFYLLRYVPGRTAVHRLWAGTKLLAIVGFGAVLTFQSSWGSEAVLAGTLICTLLLARIPPRAAPRVPKWIWIGIGLSALPTLFAGGHPELHLGGLTVGLGALGPWARFLVLSLELLLCSYLLGWTTQLADLAPALSRLLSPLRWARLPVDELAATVALSVRCLPLLIEELRILHAARRVRGWGRPETWDQIVQEAVDLLVGALVVAVRRAREMGEAMQARGGVGQVPGSGQGPGWRDAVALVLVSCVMAGMVVA